MRRIDAFRKPFASFIQQFSGDRWLQVSNRKMASGATVIFQTDITDTVRSERVRHERELDEQARLLQATIDHLPQGICMFSAQQQLKAWNRSLVELLSFPIKLLTPHLSVGRLFKVLRMAQFSLSPAVSVSLDEWLSDPSLRPLSNVEVMRSDGTVLSISSSAIPDGRFVVTFADVTKERQATLALKEANETLEQRVEERTAELRREVMERRAVEVQLLQAKDEAEEANKSKTRFLAAASHDLLQPLNASRIFLSLLQETDLNARQARFVSVADKAFASVEQLLGALLDISRFEAKNVETNIADFALDDVLQTLVTEFMPVGERRHVKLGYVPTSLWIRSDQGLLRRIVQNLLSNALRYSERGRVLVGARRKRDRVFIEVWDTGPGIPDDQRDVIFEEFRRLHLSAGEEEKAMGLGLAIVDRIARILGHQVHLTSWVGRGSCFAVEVPATLAATPKGHQPPRSAPLARVKITQGSVIIVENDLQILEGMVELLESRHFDVIPTVSAEEAIDALDTLERLPSLVLADFHLDQGTGLDAVRLLRKTCGSSIPAIMITADHSAQLRSELVRENIRFIGKPLRPDKLFECMAELVG